MTHFLDERTLQRCLDGELSEDEQHALLRQLDRSPDGWRVVALAFFEHQLWTQAGRDYIYEPPPPVVAPADPEPETRRDHSWLRHTALAACTLIAVGLGYLGGTQRFWPGGSSSTPSPSMALAPQPDSMFEKDRSKQPIVQAPRKRWPPAQYVRVMPSDENSRSFSVPAYDAEALKQIGSLPQPQLSEEAMQNLRDQGFQVEQESHLYEMPNTQNRKLVVPFNTIQFRQPLQ
ncbi:MAG: hypothetical protein U0929_20405 [Planctomycetaceae bacterium]